MSPPRTDRAAALRAAVRAVVADRGLHGASVSHIARTAGVAAGTAYVHYADKEDLVLAAYVEAKRALGHAAVEAASGVDGLRERFVALWTGAYDHLRAHGDDARFLLQVDASPLAPEAHARVAAHGPDALLEEVSSSGLRDALAEVGDDRLLYEVGLAPAVRLAARAQPLDADELAWVSNACFTAVTTPPPVRPDSVRTDPSRP